MKTENYLAIHASDLVVLLSTGTYSTGIYRKKNDQGTYEVDAAHLASIVKQEELRTLDEYESFLQVPNGKLTESKHAVTMGFLDPIDHRVRTTIQPSLFDAECLVMLTIEPDLYPEDSMGAARIVEKANRLFQLYAGPIAASKAMAAGGCIKDAIIMTNPDGRVGYMLRMPLPDRVDLARITSSLDEQDHAIYL